MKTVYELIQELSKYPSNTPIGIAIPNGDFDKYTGIAFVDEMSLRGSILLRTDIEYKDLED